MIEFRIDTEIERPVRDVFLSLVLKRQPTRKPTPERNPSPR